MANEIRASVTLRVANGNLVEDIATGTKTFNQASVGGPSPGYVTIGTSEETISLGEIGTLGFCFIQNLDATNYVRFGNTTGSYFGRLKPGEFAFVRLEPGITLRMIANTAACKCLVKVFED